MKGSNINYKICLTSINFLLVEHKLGQNASRLHLQRFLDEESECRLAAADLFLELESYRGLLASLSSSLPAPLPSEMTALLPGSGLSSPTCSVWLKCVRGHFKRTQCSASHGVKKFSCGNASHYESKALEYCMSASSSVMNFMLACHSKISFESCEVWQCIC